MGSGWKARRRRRVQSGADQMAHARSSREERAELRSLPPVSRNSIFRRLKILFCVRVMIIDTSGIAVSRQFPILASENNDFYENCSSYCNSA